MNMTPHRTFRIDTRAGRTRPDVRRVSRSPGFTLMEVMITVAIVAILAAIALPSYLAYVQRGRVSQVTSILGNAQVQAEQYFNDNLTYATFACPPSTTSFTVSCGTPTATTYTITATGTGDMNGFVYTINQANLKTTTGPWVTGTVNCWIFRKGDTC